MSLEESSSPAINAKQQAHDSSRKWSGGGACNGTTLNFDMRISRTICQKLCLVLVISAALYGRASAPRYTSGASFLLQGAANKEPGSKKKIEFTRGMMGQFIESGEIVGFTDFTAADGMSVQIRYKDFASEQLAGEFFDKVIASARNVITTGKKVNKIGKPVGKRAEILFLWSNSSEAVYGVVWTDGVKFHEIRSSSLRDALDLEKVYKY